jgi:hypothetical protein
MSNGPAGIIPATIMQLRTLCPLLGGRVAGAAEFRKGLEPYNANLVLPAAYVLPLGGESSGPGAMTGIYQEVRQTFGIAVEFPAMPDRRGQQAAMDTEAMEACLHAALLNWEPVPCLTIGRQGYWFSGSRVLDLDRARMFFQWEYTLNTILTDEQGWHPDSIDLAGIELDIWKTPPQDFPVTPPTGPPPPIIAEIDTVNGVAPPASPWPPVRRNPLI